MFYEGIVVTMPDGVVPEPEKIGVDCEISQYEAINYGVIDETKLNGYAGWEFQQSVEPTENQYVLNVGSTMSEDEAVEFAKKLVIRGAVEKADILYRHYISTGSYIPGAVYIEFNNDSEITDFSIDDYPEIKEILKYNEYDDSYKCEVETWKGKTFVSMHWVPETSGYMENESDDVNQAFDTVAAYNDVKKLNDVMTAKYDEIKCVDSDFIHPLSADKSDAVCPVEIKWGDATNDDKIDLYDAIETAKYILGTSNMSEDSVLLADINRDGVTDLLDVIDIAELINS